MKVNCNKFIDLKKTVFKAKYIRDFKQIFILKTEN